MSRLDHQSFDILSPAQLQATGKLSFVGSGIVAVTGRHGNGLTGTSGATETQNSIQTRVLTPGSPDEGYVGFAIKFSSLPAGDQKIWELRDDVGTVQLTGVIRSDGTHRTYQGTTAGTLLATTGTAFVAAAAWRYLELGFLLQGTDPILEIRSTVSGSTPSIAFADLVSAFTRTWAQLVLFVTDTIIIDDVYINDAVTITPSTFSGDTEIRAVVPVALTRDLAYFPWTPNSGTDKVAPIDDSAEDDDATYLYTRDSYSTVQYQMTAITDDGRTVDDVLIVAILRTVGSAWLPTISVSWTRWDGIWLTGAWSIASALSTAYSAFQHMTKAAGGLGGNDWTIPRVNDTRFGVRS